MDRNLAFQVLRLTTGMFLLLVAIFLQGEKAVLASMVCFALSVIMSGSSLILIHMDFDKLFPGK